MVKLNGPFGAGSQLASLSPPGLSFWKYKSSDPSAPYLNGIQLLTANRLSGFATCKPSASYSVTDQKASAGGMSVLPKWSVYLLVPSSCLPDSSARFIG